MREIRFQCALSDIVIIKRLLAGRGLSASRISSILRQVQTYDNRIQSCVGLRITKSHKQHEEDLRAIFASNSKDVRRIKAEIIGSTRVRSCPYCGINAETGSIDHYIAMTLMSDYSLCSKNLVPSCSTCNTSQKRLKKAIVSGKRKFIHPYYDQIDRHKFVQCTLVLIAGSKYRLSYSVNPVNGHLALSEVVASHFEEMDLGLRYSRRALGFVDDVRDQCRRDIRRGMFGGIRSNLMAEISASKRDFGHNHWKEPLLIDMTRSVDRLIVYLTSSLELCD